MLQYISENLAEELRVDDIAENAMISKSECTRCFHENLGIAPIQYIKQLRIDTAASQLRLTDRAVSEIACECGFQDMSYFAKTFKNIKGVTPSEYRDA